MWERNIGQSPPVYALTSSQTHSLGMCPEQKSNLKPSGARTMLQQLSHPARAVQNNRLHDILISLNVNSSSAIINKATWSISMSPPSPKSLHGAEMQECNPAPYLQEASTCSTYLCHPLSTQSPRTPAIVDFSTYSVRSTCFPTHLCSDITLILRPHSPHSWPLSWSAFIFHPCSPATIVLLPQGLLLQSSPKSKAIANFLELLRYFSLSLSTTLGFGSKAPVPLSLFQLSTVRGMWQYTQ